MKPTRQERRLQAELLSAPLIGAAILLSSITANAAFGILSSVIGYDIGSPMRVIVRHSDSTFLGPNATFDVLTKSGSSVVSGSIVKWGLKWNQYWWVADFSGLEQPGTYKMNIKNGATTVATSDTFQVAANNLWDKTWFTVDISQGEARAKLAYAKTGWQDCGSFMQEASSHVSQVVGLEDMLDHGRVPDSSKTRVYDQIKVGCQYLIASQDTARLNGQGDGPLFHDLPIWMSQHSDLTLSGDMAKAGLVWARASRLLAAFDPAFSATCLDRSIRAVTWLRAHGVANLSRDYGCNPNSWGSDSWNHPKDLMTTDLVMLAWATVELTQAGHPEYQDTAVQLIDRIIARQIPSSAKEGGVYYGQFRAFEDSLYSEKAWVHDGNDYSLGQTFPHYLMPVIRMLDLWPTHPKAAAWKQMLHDFAYGYFLPACSANPFFLLPQGYYKYPTEQGLLDFCGVWHGRNGSYGSAAALALEFERIFNDPRFRSIATGNMQWIAGLNAGITNGAFKVGRSPNENPPYGGFQLAGDTARSVSQIVKIGDRWFGGWSGIAGTISNGFSSDTQFQIGPPVAAQDGPNFFTDEDWIVHSGGWLSAISYMSAAGAVTGTVNHQSNTVHNPLSISFGIFLQNNSLIVRNALTPVWLSVCSMSGRALFHTVTHGHEEVYRIPISNLELPSGSYVITAQEGHTSLSRQFVIQR